MIGDVLKRTRIIYGYKASEMSSELGISASYLSGIENNKKQPSFELLQNKKSFQKFCGWQIKLEFLTWKFYKNRNLYFMILAKKLRLVKKLF